MDVLNLICCPSMYFILIHVHHSFTIVKSCPRSAASMLTLLTGQKPLLWAWVGYSVNEGDGAGGQPVWRMVQQCRCSYWALQSTPETGWRTLSEQPWGQLECLHSLSWTSSGLPTPMSWLLSSWLVLWTYIKLMGNKNSLLFFHTSHWWTWPIFQCTGTIDLQL